MAKYAITLTTKTTVTLTTRQLCKALETGTFTGRKILDAEWTYTDVVTDYGRGEGDETYEPEVTGVTLTLRG